MKLVNRIKKVEEIKREKSIMPPVIVKSLDELDPKKNYSVVIIDDLDDMPDDNECEGVQIHGYYASHPVSDSWKR